MGTVPVSSDRLVELCGEKLGWKKSATCAVLKKLCDKGLLKNENATGTVVAVHAAVLSDARLRRRLATAVRLYENVYTACELRQMGPEVKRAYSLSLMSFAAGRRFPVRGPLAFWESDAKRRIQNVLAWRRARVGMVFLAVSLCAAVTATCCTNADLSRSWVEAEKSEGTGPYGVTVTYLTDEEFRGDRSNAALDAACFQKRCC